ncbi:MAG: dTDP-4-dehydrorhamnose 3,5-epimerase [Desulfobacterales bacterium]|nr:dTDP-4-dehydrorhamnose 3,5-epimerase [Desulfobacterales bacterium]
MKIIQTALDDVVIVEPNVFNDKRGFFFESYNQKRYMEFKIDDIFVQDNISYSVKNTIRGLHYQKKNPQSKLIQAITGEIFDVALDIRPNSKNFGKWVGVTLSGQNKRQLLIPKGFAHGFCVLSESAHVLYKCSDFYDPNDEGGILWCDPEMKIDWPVTNPIVSDKDKQLPTLSKSLL